MGRRSARLALAALLSAALHAALLLMLSRLEAPPAPRFAGAAQALVELEVEEVAPTRDVAEPPKAGEQAPARAAMPRKTKPVSRAAADARAEAAAPGAPDGTAPEPRPDLPRNAATDRYAPGSAIARGYGVGELGGAGAGVTLRPGDVDPAAEAARERALVGARIDQALADAQAAHRAQTGAIDSYFDQLRKALTDAAEHPPQFKDATNPVAAALRSYTAGLRRYGATGNPYSPSERPSGLEPGGPGAPEPGNERDPDRFAALNRANDFLEGKFGSGIVALVEVRQDAGGRLLGTRLVASSGLREFDAYVLDSVPTAIAGLAPPPPHGLGLHPEGNLSLWAFEGKIVYLQPMQGAGDAVYLVLPFQFEETTGEVYVAKIDKPQFKCRVRLLAVY